MIRLRIATETFNKAKYSRGVHYVKSARIRSFSGPYFSAFGLNTDRYVVSLCIQSEYGKIWTRKTPNRDFFHAVIFRALSNISDRAFLQKQSTVKNPYNLEQMIVDKFSKIEEIRRN